MGKKILAIFAAFIVLVGMFCASSVWVYSRLSSDMDNIRDSFDSLQSELSRISESINSISTAAGGLTQDVDNYGASLDAILEAHRKQLIGEN